MRISFVNSKLFSNRGVRFCKPNAGASIERSAVLNHDRPGGGRRRDGDRDVTVTMTEGSSQESILT